MHYLNMHSWRFSSIWNPEGVQVKSRFSELACREGRALHLGCCRCLSLLFITIAFHQLYDVHMSIECEDFAHKRAWGKTTSPANQLIIIPQMGCSVRAPNTVSVREELKIKTARGRKREKMEEGKGETLQSSLKKSKRRLSGIERDVKTQPRFENISGQMNPVDGCLSAKGVGGQKVN